MTGGVTPTPVSGGPGSGTPVSARGMLRQWLRGRLAITPDSVSLPVLKQEALDHFIQDPAFIRALVNETLTHVFYAETQQVVAKTRGFGLIIRGDELVSRDELSRRTFLSRRDPSRWSGWLEHVGRENVNLLKMTREHLLLAAEERRQRANRDHAIARLWIALADRMTDGQTVEEVFGVDDIERLHIELSQTPHPATLQPGRLDGRRRRRTA